MRAHAEEKSVQEMTLAELELESRRLDALIAENRLAVLGLSEPPPRKSMGRASRMTVRFEDPAKLRAERGLRQRAPTP